jgi:hypothetical protein
MNAGDEGIPYRRGRGRERVRGEIDTVESSSWARLIRRRACRENMRETERGRQGGLLASSEEEDSRCSPDGTEGGELRGECFLHAGIAGRKELHGARRNRGGRGRRRRRALGSRSMRRLPGADVLRLRRHCPRLASSFLLLSFCKLPPLPPHSLGAPRSV